MLSTGENTCFAIFEWDCMIDVERIVSETMGEDDALSTGAGFSPAQREFIRENDWDFISTYMSQQASWELQECNIPYFELTEHLPDDPLVQAFLPAWRLRFLLSYFRELRDIVDRILREISFQVEPVDQVYRGEIRGQLNVMAYWQSRTSHTSIPLFPCRVTQLDYNTEENQLLAFLLLKMREQLRTTIPPEAVGRAEERVIQDNLDYISSVLHQAYFEQIMSDESIYLRLDALPHTIESFRSMLDRITQRYERQIIANAYADLVDWFQSFYLKKGAQPTQADRSGPTTPLLRALSYNDAGFDNTLYELWLLARLVKRIRDQYHYDIRTLQPFYKVTATHLAGKASKAEPVCTLVSSSGGQLRVFYRKGKGVLWGNPQEGLYDRPYWADLQGMPDITLVLGEGDGPYTRFILDAKNRHWGKEQTPPSEETYKMVGYLSNFRASEIKGGVLLFRSDTEPKWRSYDAGGGTEVLITASVSPDKSGGVCQNQINRLCEFILDRFGLLALAHSLTLESQRARQTYQAALDTYPSSEKDIVLEELFLVPLYQYCDRLAIQHAQDVERHIGLLRAEHLGNFVDRMSSEGQQYLATAEMLYKEMDPTGNYDYAAALIGYTRCMEREVNYQLLLPFKRYASTQGIDLSPSVNLSRPTREATLGGIVTELKRCIEPTYARTSVYAELKQWIKTHARDSNYLLNRFPNLLDSFNVEYRQGAAHTERVTFALLQSCRHLVLGIGSKNRLLFDFMDALNSRY